MLLFVVALVFFAVGTMVAILHRQITKSQTLILKEKIGVCGFGLRKIAPWDHHGTGALLWCEKRNCRAT